MPILKVSKRAENDLYEIGKYTEDKWGLDKRNKYLDDIAKRFHQLTENPGYLSSKDLSDVKKRLL